MKVKLENFYEILFFEIKFLMKLNWKVNLDIYVNMYVFKFGFVEIV